METTFIATGNYQTLFDTFNFFLFKDYVRGELVLKIFMGRLHLDNFWILNCLWKKIISEHSSHVSSFIVKWQMPSFIFVCIFCMQISQCFYVLLKIILLPKRYIAILLIMMIKSYLIIFTTSFSNWNDHQNNPTIPLHYSYRNDSMSF